MIKQNKPNIQNNQRLQSLDFMKGLATISMVIFHYFYLAKLMNIKDYNCSSGILYFLAKFANTTFILISGISLSLSYQKHKQTQKEKSKKQSFLSKKSKRILLLMSIGLMITLISYITFPHIYIRFGIFHFLATATLIGSLIVKFNGASLVLSLLLFIFYNLCKHNTINLTNFCYKNPFFCFITGIKNIQYNAMDHFSLMPFLCIFLIGITIGKIISHRQKLNLNNNNNDNDNHIENNNDEKQNILKKLVINPVTKLGQYSLEIYIIHFIVFYFYLKHIKTQKIQNQEIEQLFQSL